MSPSTAALAGACFPGPRPENETWTPGESRAVLDQEFPAALFPPFVALVPECLGDASETGA